MSRPLRSGFVLPENGRELPALLSKLRLLALRRLLTESPPGLPVPFRPALARLQSALPAWLRADAHAASAFDSPDVLAPLLAWESSAVDAGAALACVPHLMLVLAQRGVPSALLWDVPFARLANPDAGWMLELAAPAQGLTIDPTGLELRLADGMLHRLGDRPDALGPRSAFFSVTPDFPGLRLATTDTNPLAQLEAHPDKHGNAVDLGGRDAGEWCRALAVALDLVRATLPELHREMQASLRRIVPVGYEPEMHLSASYREAPGLVYVTLHPNPVTLAEALIHETQHGKLNALSFFDSVLENGHSEWAASPVRPDLRPLMGVLLAAHAFVPVAEFHRGLLERGHELSRGDAFARRRAEVLESNARGLAVLREKGRPTEIGARLLSDLEALHASTSTDA